MEDKVDVSQRGTRKHDRAPVLVCEVMNEKTVWCWRHRGI